MQLQSCRAVSTVDATTASCAALHMASGNGHASVATTLINAGAVSVTGKLFPLQICLGFSCKVSIHLTQCIEQMCLVQDVSAKNEEGNTPLHYACLNGHIDVVRLLMLHGASASELNR